MFKRVRNMFNRQSANESEKHSKQKGASEYLHVEGADAEQVERKKENYTEDFKKNEGTLESDGVRSSTSEWDAGTRMRSEIELDKVGDSRTLDNMEAKSSTSDSIKPIAISYRSGLVVSGRPIDELKKQKKKTKNKFEFKSGKSVPDRAKTFTKNKSENLDNHRSDKMKQMQQNSDGMSSKQTIEKDPIAAVRTKRVGFADSEQIIIAREELLPQAGSLSEEKLSKMLENKEKYMNMDSQEKRHLYKCGKNFLRGVQIPSWAENSREIVEDETLNEDKGDIPRKRIYQPDETLNQKVALWYGDITRLEIDVVVNSTSSLLLDDVVGVNKAIREAAGSELDLDLEAKWQLRTGSVFKTCGYQLPAQWIYHVSGPSGYWVRAQINLSMCYVSALNLMKEDKLRTIAFPCISAGNKRLRLDISSKVALNTVRDWLKENHEHVDKIIFCVFEKLAWKSYISQMHIIFPAAENMSKTALRSKLPAEILRMDSRSIELYKKALEEGKEKDYSIRIMVTGPYGVGKSTFTKRLLCQDVNINERNSTDGIDVHVKKCKVSLETSQWIVDRTDSKEDNTVQRLAKVLKNASEKDTADTFGLDETDSPNNGTAEETESEGNHNRENKLDVSVDEVDGVYIQDPGEVPNENSCSNSGDFDCVDGVQETVEDNRLKHEELLMRDLKEVILNADKNGEKEDHADVSVWDFGGQFVFYTTHQMFLSHRAIYILINNMSQHIGDVVIDDESYFDCSGTKCLKIEDFLDIWLNSVHGHSKSERPGLPPVILVGTHADKLNPDCKEEQTEAVFDAIRNRFAGKDVSLHFVDKDFGLSNATVDPKLDDLRHKIIEVAKEQLYWGEVKPAKWIPFEKLLEELRRKGVEILGHSEIEQLNQNLPVPITGDEELELFLRFQHEIANIMYFSLPELKSKIVLSPQFLVNALKSMITAEMFCKKRPEILDKWMEFRQKGILRTRLLDAVWNREENRQFRENREHILALMEHLNIVARPILYPEDEERDDDDSGYYLVPCMLKESPPESIFHAERPFISTPCLCLVVENVAFPSAVFNRLLVGCMACWPVAKSGKKYHIYCGCGQFDVDVQHRLTLSFRSNVVALRITRYSQTNRHPSVSICSSVYSTVKQILERISKYLSLVLTFDECVQCPLSPADSMVCMHSVEKLKSCDEFPCHEHHSVVILHSCDLLKYWYEIEDTDYNNSSDGCVQSSVLAPVIASRVPTEKELVKISQGIGLEFQQLFLELGISNARIGQIRGSNPHSVADQVIQLLLEWRRQRGCLATYRELETAMKSVGTDTATAFKDFLE